MPETADRNMLAKLATAHLQGLYDFIDFIAATNPVVLRSRYAEERFDQLVTRFAEFCTAAGVKIPDADYIPPRRDIASPDPLDRQFATIQCLVHMRFINEITAHATNEPRLRPYVEDFWRNLSAAYVRFYKSPPPWISDDLVRRSAAEAAEVDDPAQT